MRPFRMTTRRWMFSVAGVAGLLAGGLFYLDVGEAKARGACANNLKSIGLAMHMYHNAYNTFPPGTVVNPDLPPSRRLSWMVFIFQYVEQGISVIIDLLTPWDSVGNQTPFFLLTSNDEIHRSSTAPAGNPRILHCPAHPGRADSGTPGPSDYVGIAGLGTDAAELPTDHPRAGVFGYDRHIRMEDIKDGSGNTMMIAETSQTFGPWIAGGRATVRGLDPARQPYIGRGRQFGGMHRGGVMVAFADGSVRVLSENIDPKVFEALSTIAGGEPLPDGWNR